MLSQLTALIILAACGAQGLALDGTHLERNNLAYRSPYSNHDSLAVNTRAIVARHDEGAKVLSRKRQLPPQIVAPQAAPNTYTHSGYGIGPVDWSDTPYIYAGDLNFTHSVASGDPYDYSVLLWTRAVGVQQAPVDVPICVAYQVFDGMNATGNIVSSGYALTSYDVDNTIKVEAIGLSASTYYSYQFSNCANPDNKSPIGRTKTAPGYKATKLPQQRFAVYSCSNYPNGFFNSYGGPVANEDVDYVVHLGDYIYEGGTGGASINRTHSGGKELATVYDYRARYAQYRTDPDLSANHQLFPWINIWDDHETANNDWKAGSQNSNDSYPAGCSFAGQTGVCFSERAANAKRAYHEWIPIRQVDVSDEQRIWRDFGFGDLVDIIALDTRKYDRDITDLSSTVSNTDYVGSLAVQLNSSRSITGPVQNEWFMNKVDESIAAGHHWRLVLNQVVFGTINYSATATSQPSSFQNNWDSWDGYQAQRQTILQHADDHDWKDVVMVTGDTHASWLFENNLDTVLVGTADCTTTLSKQPNTTSATYKRGQIVEYAGSAVSSSGWGNSWLNERNATSRAASQLVQNSGSLLWSEGFYRGYMNIAISYGNITTTYFGYPDNQVKRTQNRTQSAQFVQLPGKNMVERPLQVEAGAVKPGN